MTDHEMLSKMVSTIMCCATFFCTFTYRHELYWIYDFSFLCAGILAIKLFEVMVRELES
jgi:hypothetical protein